MQSCPVCSNDKELEKQNENYFAWQKESLFPISELQKNKEALERNLVAANSISPFLCRTQCIAQSVDVIIWVSNRTEFTESLPFTFV